MPLDPKRYRGLLRSLWRKDERRDHEIRAEHRSGRRWWKEALRRGDEPQAAAPRPRPAGRRSLSVAPLTLRAFTRQALHVGDPGWQRPSPPLGERLTAVLAALPAGRLRSAATQHLLRLDHFCTDGWQPWHVRFAERLAPWQRRRVRRYQEAIPLGWRGWRDMLDEFAVDPALRALFNERLAQAHRPPRHDLRWHPWVEHMFRHEPGELMVDPPRLLSPEEAKALDPWWGTPPCDELFDRLWSARHKPRRLSLSSHGFTTSYISAPKPALVYRRYERGLYRGHPGTVDDPRHHPEGWGVMVRFFELWRAGVRDVAALREATRGAGR